MNFRNGTRLIQTREQKKKKRYLLYNNQLSNSLIINSAGAKLVKKLFNNKKNIKINDNFIKGLINYKFVSLIKNKLYSSQNLMQIRCPFNYPLTNLNMELTNRCNLKCIHCYGSFYENKINKFLPFEWIYNSLNDFDILNVKSISLTGGECTLHPQFIDIVLLLLQRGYDLCIFTNGYNYEIIHKLLENTKKFKYIIKISLDSFEEVHNLIRGNKNSFSRTTKCLNILKNYDNIIVYISTVIMKQNLKLYYEFNSYIAKEYPNFIHTTDLIFPEGNGNKCSFSIDELKSIKANVPNLFKAKEIIDKKTKRCSGGISQCTITPDGFLKICNSACDNEFMFKYNALEKGIIKSWIDCGKNINFFRKEKKHSCKQCKKCIYKKQCNITNCRVLAKSYTGCSSNCNPITCIIAKGEIK